MIYLKILSLNFVIDLFLTTLVQGMTYDRSLSIIYSSNNYFRDFDC